MTFWQRLAKNKKPFLVLAPMEDVTDVVFRQVIEKIAPPDVFFTEFTNIEAILHQETSRLVYKKTKIPTVAQIWGVNPESFYKVAQLISDMGFLGIDINMGCPQRPELKIGACAALINNHTLVSEIIDAVKKGTKLPVSVKTRIGVKNIQTEEWIGFLLTQKLDALTVHGRTVKEMSSVPARWDEIKKVIKINTTSTVIVGNGDVKGVQDASYRAQETGVDGVMIGRGVLENPWCFSDHISTREEKINLLKRHLELWQETWGDKKNFSVLKKYFKIYIRDFEGASEMRTKLMENKSIVETRSFFLISELKQPR
ncbi:tRNA-dihydrouridine synthase [Candidatus Amesbacteria bacterium]|nr:tRNA-dihydrouridine synthase [Candidatus Amesbacteria bacterium]